MFDVILKIQGPLFNVTISFTLSQELLVFFNKMHEKNSFEKKSV